jgi:thiol-disulfide isomerase/thioredoxin
MYPNELQTAEQVAEKIKELPAVLLYFYSDKCAPCISLRPKVVELVCDVYPRLRIYFINSESNPEIAAAYHSFSNPTLILFFDGKEYRRMNKYVAIPQLSEEIRKPYFLLFEETD